ncbi:MAG: MBL fold metallo-hydrolase [Pseudomonadota bacterium]
MAAARPSEIPFVKDVQFEYGRPDALSPLIRRVIARNPGPFTYTGSGTYIIGREAGPVAVIDPGPDLPEHIDALLDAIGEATVSHILITHTHQDHCGGARAFAERAGAPILGFGPHPTPKDKPMAESPALEEDGDAAFAPDTEIGDGHVVAGDGWRLEAIHTPGHLSNHLCFALPEEKALFTGDHVMGWSTTVVAPPDGDMGAYMESLDLLLARDDARYYPTHGAPIDAPQRFVRAIRAHRRIRDGQILEQLRDGKTRIPEIVDAVYQGLDPRLKPAAALNVLAHLIRLQRVGDVAVDGEAGLEAAFALQEAVSIATVDLQGD